ncbi:DUF2637 domain-containing protein [Streptomyces sp. NBC_00825]|uniref:DUF2637 domain-containing protein n=1 Tax=unclassified Streptomyces TaxID=2593676 RepID=UPI002ED4AAFD|nr:DUF2637 domain-containing protein [Streptomyces sp. NBC_00825]WTI02976.1 DUF2637 domain-containing protein [Streptomyces sp. NBC_00822]
MQRRLVATVAGGAVLIAAIGFAGSYAAVRGLAVRKGFGDFALVFPIGIDAGIIVLLALDLLLSWMRMPFPLLRHTAWLLTAATIAFNGAAAWPDPLGVGMHAVIPVLFVVVVEAARTAVGRLADITADRHIEPVRLSRWLLSPVPTFRLWRRMKLWELRSYEQVINLEQDRLIYKTRLQARFGRNWRRKAPVESLLPLRLARYGRPLPGSDAQPDPVEVEQVDAVDAFDQAAAEALALAPPTPAALAPAPAPEQPAPDADAQPDPGADAGPTPRTRPVAVAHLDPDAVAVAHPDPDADAHLDPDADAHPDPDADADAQPFWWLPPRTLILDLAPMHPAIPEVTADAHLPPPPPHPTASASDEPFVVAAVELARTGPLTLRRVQNELHVGQSRAQRIIPAAKSRIRAAASPQPQPIATASGVHS